MCCHNSRTFLSGIVHLPVLAFSFPLVKLTPFFFPQFTFEAQHCFDGVSESFSVLSHFKLVALSRVFPFLDTGTVSFVSSLSCQPVESSPEKQRLIFIGRGRCWLERLIGNREIKVVFVPRRGLASRLTLRGSAEGVLGSVPAAPRRTGKKIRKHCEILRLADALSCKHTRM